ncbi:MAG: hypothetical protein A2007_01365 [Verrucomicrobia bacterium GWC2_42_7]|nr:MAG: hypothetical protein A2007_01365 [Verrucomicrobia bacterium GWC2_42_7]
MSRSAFFLLVFFCAVFLKAAAVRWDHVPVDRRSAVLLFYHGMTQMRLSLSRLQSEVLIRSFDAESLSFKSGKAWYDFHKNWTTSKIKEHTQFKDSESQALFFKNLNEYFEDLREHAEHLDKVLNDLNASLEELKLQQLKPTDYADLSTECCKDAAGRVGLIMKSIQWFYAFELASDILLRSETKALSEDEYKKMVERMENMTVDQHPIENSHPDPGTPVIRKKLAEYEKQNSVHRLLFFAGHDCPDKKKLLGGFSNDGIWYAVDPCFRETKPDAVLYALDKQDMLYFKPNWADVICIGDYRRGREQEVIKTFLSILKPGGKLIIPLSTANHKDWLNVRFGAQLSPDTQEREIDLQKGECSGKFWVSPDGREGYTKRMHDGNPSITALFQKIATENAKNYYRKLGASDVVLSKMDGACFFIVKK